MRKTTGPRNSPGEKIVKDIKRATRKQYSSEETVRIVLDGLRGEDSHAGYRTAVFATIERADIANGTNLTLLFAGGALADMLAARAGIQRSSPATSTGDRRRHGGRQWRDGRV